MRRPDDRAHVAGVAHPMEIDRQRASRLGPALLVNADDPRPRAQRADRVEERRLDVLAGNQYELWIAPGGRGGRHQVLALGDEQARAIALAARAQLADPLQLLVVWGGDQFGGPMRLRRSRKRKG